jgi:hypothetical protein
MKLAEGMLSIPYRHTSRVVGIKFRRLDEGTPEVPYGQQVRRLAYLMYLICISKATRLPFVKVRLTRLYYRVLLGYLALEWQALANGSLGFQNSLNLIREFSSSQTMTLKRMDAILRQELAKRIKEDLDKAEVVHLPDNTDVNE